MALVEVSLLTFVDRNEQGIAHSVAQELGVRFPTTTILTKLKRDEMPRNGTDQPSSTHYPWRTTVACSSASKDLADIMDLVCEFKDRLEAWQRQRDMPSIRVDKVYVCMIIEGRREQWQSLLFDSIVTELH
jgi:hypothetical protein